MGADGGLEFWKLKDPKRREELETLLKHFQVTYFYKIDLANNVSQDSFSDFLATQNSFDLENYLLGAYGTDLFGYTFNDLKEVVEMIVELNDQEMTFKDLLLEKETRPENRWSYDFQKVDFILAGFTKCSSYLKDESFLSMKITDWAKKVSSILDMDARVEHVETWT